ncbi:MAG: hypothetical protein HYS07_00115 [Chlamydiae bacterium]|nr:hypothetical protein [Chlamydiota bacterium]MBI3276312.1 hypothetical protein [Chlamydiota bacterium]
MLNQVSKHLKEDCREHGFGRKAWWARRLEVPALTISHWLAHRQDPNGTHTQLILDVFQEETATQNSPVWINFLWKCYFEKIPVEREFFQSIIPLILQAKSLNTRTLAFLSNIIILFQLQLTSSLHASSKLKNRIGWLMEISNFTPTIEPERRKWDFLCDIFESLNRWSNGKKYLIKQQTPIGKKWFIYDCDLTAIKRKFL